MCASSALDSGDKAANKIEKDSCLHGTYALIERGNKPGKKVK